jgi:hypothetical protein
LVCLVDAFINDEQCLLPVGLPHFSAAFCSSKSAWSSC